MQELAVQLRGERRVLDALIYRLTVTRHLVASGDVRFLGRANDELAGAVQAACEAARRRADEVSRLEPGLPAVTLLEIAGRSVEPFRTYFTEARVELAADIDEIEELVSSVRNFAHHALDEVATTYALVATDPAYAEPPDPDGLAFRASPQTLAGRPVSPAVLERLTMTPELTTLATAEQRLQATVETLAAIDLRPLAAFLG